jgi:hypothetical protein
MKVSSSGLGAVVVVALIVLLGVILVNSAEAPASNPVPTMTAVAH